jgi:hypothetical protein
MKRVKFEHIFECDENTYWDKIFFDPDFNQQLFIDTLKFVRWDAKTVEETEQVIRRDAVVEPAVGDIPKTVKKVIGDNFGYTEHGSFDREAKRFDIDVVSNVKPDKFHCQGKIYLEKVDDKRSRRIAEFEVDVQIFAVGKIIEGIIVRDMEREFDIGAKFTNEWIKDKGL